jgi:hypothetical protein
MNVDTSYLTLNASESVTPLNLNGWLREQLRAQAFDDVEDEDEITVLLFVTETCIGTLGRKKFEKLVRKAAGKHQWIDEIEVVKLKAPISDQEANGQVSQIFSQRAGTELDGLESTFLGFESESAADLFLLHHEREPVCMLRQTTARDIANVDIENAGLKLGEWCVMALAKSENEVDVESDGEGAEKLLISPSMPTMEEAMEYAKSTHQAVRLVSMPSVL